MRMLRMLTDRFEQVATELRTIRAGESPRDRIRILDMFAHCHLRVGRMRHLIGWLPRRRDEPRELKLRTGWTVIARRGDGIPLYEQFGLDAYRADLLPPVRTVLDVGANVGFATLRFARWFPDARLVCVEPDAEARGLLAKNLARNGVAAQIFDTAVVGAPGNYRIDAAAHPGGNHVTSSPLGDVEGITLPVLLDRAGLAQVDFMKIDIEGAERDLFLSAGDWASRVRALIAELHGGLTPDEVEAQLAPHGYRRLPLPQRVSFDDLVYFARG
jgi:FkbM family methyltransferase